jgi:hypothetical protein
MPRLHAAWALCVTGYLHSIGAESLLNHWKKSYWNSANLLGKSAQQSRLIFFPEDDLTGENVFL